MKRQYSKPESAARGAFDTATFGFMPKISGAIGAGIARTVRPELFKDEKFLDTYHRARDQLRQQNAEAFEQNPYSYGAGGLAGAFFNPVSRLAPTTATGTGRLMRGAGLGALYGAGSTDAGDPFDIEPSNVRDVIGSAAIGGAAEYALPPVLRGAGYAARSLTPHFIKEGISNAGRNIASAWGIPPQAPSALTAFQPQSISPAQKTIQELAKPMAAFEKGEFAAPGISKIQEAETIARKQAGSAFDVAKSQIGSLDIKEIKKFVPQMKEALVAESIDPSTHRKTYAYMKTFNNILNKEAPQNAIGVDFQRMEGWRKQLGKAINREADDAEKYGLIQLKKGYDDFLNNNIERAMLSGDTKVLDQYKVAREGWANYKKMYTADHKDEYGKKFIQDIVNNAKSDEPYSNEMIANKIFGTNKIGFKPQSLNIIKELKSHLGTDSQEFNGLRMEGLKKALTPLIENPENKAAALAKYNANLKEQMPILKELLPSNAVQELEYVGQRGSELFKGKSPSLLGRLQNTKYLGTAIKAIMPAPNLVGDIYTKGAKSNIVIPEAMSLSITTALMAPKPEEQPIQQSIATEPQPIVEAQTPTQQDDAKYEAILARMSPEQKERIKTLQNSMRASK